MNQKVPPSCLTFSFHLFDEFSYKAPLKIEDLPSESKKKGVLGTLATLRFLPPFLAESSSPSSLKTRHKVCSKGGAVYLPNRA